MKNVVIYTRVSTDEQKENGYSLLEQKDSLLRYCERKSWSVLEVIEEDHSAKNFNRPEIQKFLDKVKKGELKPDIFLVARDDRFSRNMRESLNMIFLLEKNRIEYHSMEGGYNLEQIEGFVPQMINLILAEYDNKRRALNTTIGMRRAQQEGRYMATAPKGYTNVKENGIKTIKPNDDSAHIKKFFMLFEKGTYTVKEIRDILKKDGFLISKAQSYNVLRNPVYSGKIRIKATDAEPEQIVNGIHEPIISYEQFNRVQNLLSKKARKNIRVKDNESFPLRQHLVCIKCGKNLTGACSTNRYKTKYPYYNCQKNCNERFSADFANKAFINYLEKLTPPDEIKELYSEILLDHFQSKNIEKKQSIKSLGKEIREFDDRLNRLNDKYVDDLIDQSSYLLTKQRYEKQKSDLQLKLHEIKQINNNLLKHISFGITLISNLSEFYQKASIRLKQKIIGSIFPEKLIFDGENYRTTRMNEVLTLLFSNINDFGELEKEKAAISDSQSYKVAPTRLELVSIV